VQEELRALPPADRLAKYRFEVRKVSRDGFVSYDGVRYGVPWTYSGRDMNMKDINGFVEIYWDKELIVLHKKQHRSWTLVMFEHQYANLVTAQGHAYPKQHHSISLNIKVELYCIKEYIKAGFFQV